MDSSNPLKRSSPGSGRKPHSSSAEKPKPGKILDFPNQRGYAERSSTRYPSANLVHGCLAISEDVGMEVCRAQPLKPIKHPAPLPLAAKPSQRCSIAEATVRDAPPPLQPRQMKVNQSMRGRTPQDRKSGVTMQRPLPLRNDGVREGRSQSL